MAHATFPVLIIGAGPAGLAAAVGLAMADVPVVVVEQEEQLPIDLRAGAFHPPTLEMLDRLGVGDEFRQRGIVARKWHFRDRVRGLVAEFDLGLLSADTPYPFRLHCEQWKLTPLLMAKLRAMAGGEVQFGATLIETEARGDAIAAKISSAGGIRELEASYVIGADGARSIVRRDLGIEFEGFTWPERYLVASTDFDLGRFGYAHASYISDPAEWCAVMNMPHHGGSGLWRMAFPIGPEVSDETALESYFVRSKVENFAPELKGCEIPYSSIYKVHQRVAATFHKGRCMLIGDAAHINNPMGGMGVNSAIHDAVDLASKLAPIWHGHDKTPMETLARFSRRRRQVNIDHVQAQSIRNKRMLEEKEPAARQRMLDEMSTISKDAARAYRYLLDTSMISSLRQAAQIT